MSQSPRQEIPGPASVARGSCLKGHSHRCQVLCWLHCYRVGRAHTAQHRGREGALSVQDQQPGSGRGPKNHRVRGLYRQAPCTPLEWASCVAFQGGKQEVAPSSPCMGSWDPQRRPLSGARSTVVERREEPGCGCRLHSAPVHSSLPERQPEPGTLQALATGTQDSGAGNVIIRPRSRRRPKRGSERWRDRPETQRDRIRS